MTLFRQNLLSLVPLFFILGVLYALISFHLQTKELKWAIDQEALAIGHTMQSFAEQNADRYFDSSNGQMDITPEFEIILSRIIGQLRNETMTIRNPSGDVINQFVTAIPQADLSTWTNPESLYEAFFEGTSYTLYRHEGKARLFIDIDIDSGEGIYSISIVRDAAEYMKRINGLRLWIFFEILISIAIGIVVSIVLTLFVRNRIKNLTTQSEKFLGGNANLRLDQGSITEFNDLGSTLNILVNVFHKNMDWYRKSIQQKERDRTSHNLAEFIMSGRSKTISLNAGKINVTAEYVGNEIYPFFMGQTSVGSSKIFIWGSVNEDDPVEAALLTEGIKLYILKASQDPDLFSSLRHIYGSRIKDLQYIELSDSGSVMIATLDNSKEIRNDLLNIETGAIHWIHGLSDSVTEKIEMYSKNAASLTGDQLFTDITKIVGWLGSTILVSIRYDA